MGEETLRKYRRKVSEQEEQKEREQKEKKGVFTIRLEKGTIASHLIKVKGVFKYYLSDWRIRTFIKRKIKKEIDSFYEAELELLRIRKEETEVWVLIATVGSRKSIEEWSRGWLENHIDKRMADIVSLEVKSISSLAKIIDEA